jgi:hypothetical protein
VTRNGQPIDQVGVSNDVTLETGISFSAEFGEFDACIECNLDPWKWYTGQYSVEFKAKMMAYHQENSKIRLHTQDAQHKKMKKLSKRKK